MVNQLSMHKFKRLVEYAVMLNCDDEHKSQWLYTLHYNDTCHRNKNVCLLLLVHMSTRK